MLRRLWLWKVKFEIWLEQLIYGVHPFGMDSGDEDGCDGNGGVDDEVEVEVDERLQKLCECGYTAEQAEADSTKAHWDKIYSELDRLMERIESNAKAGRELYDECVYDEDFAMKAKEMLEQIGYDVKLISAGYTTVNMKGCVCPPGESVSGISIAWGRAKRERERERERECERERERECERERERECERERERECERLDELERARKKVKEASEEVVVHQSDL